METELLRQAERLEQNEELKAKAPSLLDGFDASSDLPPYLQFLSTYFPHVASKPLAERHHRLWRWVDSIELGVRIPPQVEAWPRGGAKSSTAELGVAYLGCKLSRRYVLYVSETQDQADKHVAAISTLLEKAGLERSVNKYGSSKGWRRNQLRAANGFNVEALGLDTASRGIKLDEFRPDFIIFDDIDNREDNRKATEKKIRAITNSILPSGSIDCCVLFIQNLIIDDGIVSRLVKGDADFLLDRNVSPVEPAIHDLKFDLVTLENGIKAPRIISGTPSWEGQPLEVCQAQMREWGPDAFLREAQHEVENADGIFFNVREITPYEKIEQAPTIKRIAIACDIAATEGGGDWTVAGALAEAYNGTLGVLDVVRGQWGTDNVEKNIVAFCEKIRSEYPAVALKVHIPQDPGAAGKLYAEQFVARLNALGFDAHLYGVTKAKPIVARTYQGKVNEGNTWILKGAWNKTYIEELRNFREDMSHDNDDQVDFASNATNSMLSGASHWDW